MNTSDHIILHCQNVKETRDNLFSYLENCIINFRVRDNEFKLSCILNIDKYKEGNIANLYDKFFCKIAKVNGNSRIVW